jgi:hypothetical protein
MLRIQMWRAGRGAHIEGDVAEEVEVEVEEDRDEMDGDEMDSKEYSFESWMEEVMGRMPKLRRISAR